MKDVYKRQQKGLDRMREANVTNYSLSNLDALVEVAAEEGLSLIHI